MKPKADALKPQDVLIALKLAVRHTPWQYKLLAEELGMSGSEVCHGIKRLKKSGLFNEHTQKIMRGPLREFLVHGIRYVFPAAPAETVWGMPTGISAKPLRGHVTVEERDGWVWPAGDGARIEGRRIQPLYSSAPEAAAQDASLYELLSLVDAMRAGKAREREFASEELERRLS